MQTHNEISHEFHIFNLYYGKFQTYIKAEEIGI